MTEPPDGPLTNGDIRFMTSPGELALLEELELLEQKHGALAEEIKTRAASYDAEGRAIGTLRLKRDTLDREIRATRVSLRALRNRGRATIGAPIST